MGNHASSGERRDRNKTGEFTPYSPSRVGDGQAFTFDQSRHGAGPHKTLQQQGSEEDHDPVILKVAKVRQKICSCVVLVDFMRSTRSLNSIHLYLVICKDIPPQTNPLHSSSIFSSTFPTFGFISLKIIHRNIKQPC